MLATFAVALVATRAVAAQPAADDEPLDAEIEALLGDSATSGDPPAETEIEPEVDDAPVRDPKMAKKLRDGAAKFVKKADKLAKRKKLDEAADLYRRAIGVYDKAFEIDPAAVTLLIVAGIEEKLELWYEAARRYQRALAETEQPLDDKSRARAEQRLEAVKLYLGVVVLAVTPEGASISIDGVGVGVAPLPESLLLKPGEYTVAITAEGFVPFETKLLVEAGSESERAFELEAEPVVVEAPPPPRPTPPPPPPLPPGPRKTLLYAGAGATIGLLVGASVTGVLAVGQHGTFTDPQASGDERDAAQDDGKRMAMLSDVFTVGTVVVGGLTAIYYLKVYRPRAAARAGAERERESWHDELGLTPVVTPDRAGVAVFGRF